MPSIPTPTPTPAAAAAAAPAAIPSPCISVCRMHERTGWCEGCLRTLDEIAAWSALDDRAKRAVWKLLPPRRAVFERHVVGEGGGSA